MQEAHEGTHRHGERRTANNEPGIGDLAGEQARSGQAADAQRDIEPLARGRSALTRSVPLGSELHCVMEAFRLLEVGKDLFPSVAVRACPASVSLQHRVLRWNSRAPSKSSKPRPCLLAIGFDIRNGSAAAEKLPRFAMATNALSTGS